MGQDDLNDQYSSGYSGYSSSSSGQQQQQQYGGSTASSGSGQQQQQQYAEYQPPASVTRSTSATSASDSTSFGMQGRTEAVVSYLLWWLTGGFIFLFERKNRFVRFHAAQSFLFFGAVTLVYLALQLLGAIPLLGFLLSPVLACATLVVVIPAGLIWLFMMIQAYRGVKVRLPFFGQYAEALVTRFEPKPKRSRKKP
jgi:uncharacterized membrane protein